MIEKSPTHEINQPALQGPSVKANDADKTDSAVKDGRGSESRARLFEVVIAGVPLRLKSSHDEQTVNELVALVDRKVREALPLTKTGSIQNASILASLHLAEEYLTLRRKAKVELERLETKTLKVISDLESSRMTGLQGKDEQRLGIETTPVVPKAEEFDRDVPDLSSSGSEPALDL